jgi:Tfp pilus assembly protein PilN
MSLAFLSKPIGGSKNKDAGGSADGPGPERSARPGPLRGGASNLIVGGSPRVDLMPPEIRLKRAQLRTRRKLRLALFGVFIVVVAACGAAWAGANLAQTSLASAQQQQAALIQEQSKYSGVTTLKNQISVIKAGQVVGDSTEIEWNTYINRLLGTLPPGLTLDAATIDSATPFSEYTQAYVPLQGGRIATLTLTAKSSTTPTIPPWLDALKTLPGFVDATPGAVTLSDGVYTSAVTMHIDTLAFDYRFDPKSAAANHKANIAAGTETVAPTAAASPTPTPTPTEGK